jgi:hypothetical protein
MRVEQPTPFDVDLVYPSAILSLMEMSIYRNTSLIASIDADPQTSWQAAKAYVRALAHAEGFSGPTEIGQAGIRTTRWRPFIKIGPFRAMPSIARQSLAAK